MKPYAHWTNDCQGKQDFDGPLLSVSTRYYPGPANKNHGTLVLHRGKETVLPYGAKPSAHSSIILRIGPREPDDGGGDYLVWREKKFEGETEALVKMDVETWTANQMIEIIDLLGGQLAFRKA